MACIGFNVLETMKSDAPSKLLSRDIRNESPSNTEFVIADFLNSVSLVDNTCPGRNYYGEKNGFIHSQSLVFSRDDCTPSQQFENSEVHENLLEKLSVGDAKIHDPKPTDLSDSLFTCYESNSMNLKVSSESEVDDFVSDLLSISIQDCDPHLRNGHGRSITPVCNVSLNDINIPEFCMVEENLNVSQATMKETINSSGESDFNLSDLLSSICIDDNDRSTSKSLNESSCHSLCLDDFNISEMKLPELSGKKTDLGIDSNKLSRTTSQKNLSGPEILDNLKCSRNSVKSTTDDKNSVGFSFEILSSEPVSLDCISIQELKDEANAKHTNNLGTSLDSTKSAGFSFFNDLSENQLAFSQMLDDDSKNCRKTQHSFSSSDDDSINMLDLYNSLQGSKESTSGYETNSSLSDEVAKEGSFTSMSSTSDDDDTMIAIDLSTCIKSFEDKSSFNSSMEKKNLMNSYLQSSCEHAYPPDNPILSLPLRNSVNTQAPRMNLKQSLFAKALSCKSKKDPTLVHKVANIKSELFNKVFGRSIPVTSKGINPRIEVATYSDKSIIQCNGRRVFGPTVSVSPIISTIS